MLGIVQEQHPDRCQLFAQWHKLDWPILWDPINVLESAAVPIVVAIDEHGIVRAVSPRPESFERDFLNRQFDDDPPNRAAGAKRPGRKTIGASRLDVIELRRQADVEASAASWRRLGDALILWHGAGRVDDAIDAYRRALLVDPRDGNTLFRLGVSHRVRSESDQSHAADFQAAIEFWEQALATNPNQYIWRRRIQQFGPRLEKPYPFYDWVDEARRAIVERGETPIELAVPPVGAELAQPARSFAAATDQAGSPDPDGKIIRDRDGLIEAEVTLVPSQLRPGGTARVHVAFRPNAALQAHWNNESEPLRLWVDVPPGWQVSERLLSTSPVDRPVSDEVRRLDFELQVPADAGEGDAVSAYALYYVCEGSNGTCQFLRKDFTVKVSGN
ncbi:MAG: hypothetical protein WD847_00715 [Pirellulales bacterium]